jgi:hypothetical protein
MAIIPNEANPRYIWQTGEPAPSNKELKPDRLPKGEPNPTPDENDDPTRQTPLRQQLRKNDMPLVRIRSRACTRTSHRHPSSSPFDLRDQAFAGADEVRFR